jgi:hypothetical protein
MINAKPYDLITIKTIELVGVRCFFVVKVAFHVIQFSRCCCGSFMRPDTETSGLVGVDK